MGINCVIMNMIHCIQYKLCNLSSFIFTFHQLSHIVAMFSKHCKHCFNPLEPVNHRQLSLRNKIFIELHQYKCSPRFTKNPPELINFFWLTTNEVFSSSELCMKIISNLIKSVWSSAEELPNILSQSACWDWS